jgi:hypothetical protein
LVHHLSGSTEAKRRLHALLDTLSGRQTVREAGRSLGIGVRRLHAMRRAILQELLDHLEPRHVGRPPRSAAAVENPAVALEAEVRRLRLDLQAARVREEIALAMPHVLTRSAKKRQCSPGRRGASNVDKQDT